MSSHHRVPVVTDELATQVAKHLSDLGNQHNNGAHQDQIWSNLSALCIALWAKKLMWLGVGVVVGGGGGGGGPMHQ